jgi:hypothetical protein
MAIHNIVESRDLPAKIILFFCVNLWGKSFWGPASAGQNQIRDNA